MYTFCIIMICIASILLILAVLVQSPKSGMAANFGAANQTMGVRQTTNFLEKFTWAMVAAVVFFSLLSTTALPGSVTPNQKKDAAAENAAVVDEIMGKQTNTQEINLEPNLTIPGDGAEVVSLSGDDATEGDASAEDTLVDENASVEEDTLVEEDVEVENTVE